MFFGAGNLIFPPFLGFEAGTKTLPAFIGFVITAVVFQCLALSPQHASAASIAL